MANISLGKVAPTPKGAWSSTSTYEKLDIVTYDNEHKAYLAIQDVPTGTAITNNNYWEVLGIQDTDAEISDIAGNGDTGKVWSASKSWNEVNDLKSQIEFLTDNEQVTFDVGYYQFTLSSTSVPENKSTYDAMRNVVVSCEEGDKFQIKADMTSTGYATYAFAKSDRTIISKGSNAIETLVIAPANASYLYINSKKSVEYYCYKGKFIKDNLSDLDERVTELETPAKLISKTVAIAQGTYNASLSPSSDDYKLRAQVTINPNNRYIVTINKDYELMVCNGDFWRRFSNRKMLLEFSNTTCYFLIGKLDGTTITTSDNHGFTLTELAYHNELGYDIVLAANDSEPYWKKIAEVTCNGTHDEYDIEMAVNATFTKYRECRVLLAPGTYNIESITEHYIPGVSASYASKPSTLSKCADKTAIQIMSKAVLNDANGKKRADCVIEGPKDSGGLYHIYPNNPTLVLSQSCYENLSTNEQYILIGTTRKTSGQGLGLMYGNFYVSISNLCINLYGIEKPIIGIDGIGCTQFCADSIRVRTNLGTNVKFDVLSPVAGLIGIRGLCGDCQGYHHYIRHCIVSGMHEGYALMGEHLIVEDCVSHHCYYGFTVGNYDHGTDYHMQHPIVMIGCSFEQCYQIALLNYRGGQNYSASHRNQTLIMIGTSTEATWENNSGTRTAMLGFEEVSDGIYTGRIEIDWYDLVPLVKDNGGCSRLKFYNRYYSDFGPTVERPAYNKAPEGTEYYDTTIGKMTYLHNGNYVDALGNAI